MKKWSLVLVATHSLVWASAALAGEPITVVAPEPGTLALIGTGVAALAAGAWWRNRK
jgi:hypothetical protein